jgi:hypothetical protein
MCVEEFKLESCVEATSVEPKKRKGRPRKGQPKPPPQPKPPKVVKLHNFILRSFKELIRRSKESSIKEQELSKKLAEKYPNKVFWESVSKRHSHITSLVYFFNKNVSQILDREYLLLSSNIKLKPIKEENYELGENLLTEYSKKNKTKKTIKEFME